MRKYLQILIVLLCGVVLLTSCDKKESQNQPQTSIIINTEPSGADIFYKGKVIGQTPYTQAPVRPGTKLLCLKKDHYKDKWIPLKIEAAKKNVLKIKLDQIKTATLITSKPNKATIKMNGSIIGETPLILKDLPYAQYKAEIKAPGYSPKTISWFINSERPVRVSVDLNSNTGMFKVIAQPEGCSITLDNKPMGLTPNNVEAEEGTHRIKISKDGYEPYEEVVKIMRGKIKEITAHLKIKPCQLVISTRPAGADILINGQAYNRSPQTIENLPPGTYKLQVDKDGYDSEERKINIGPGQKAEVAIIMKSNMGGIDLVTNSPGATVYLDGKEIGKIKVDEKGNAKIFKLRKLKSGTHKVKVSHKRAEPQSKTLRVRVSKGQISRTKLIKLWIADSILVLKNNRQVKGKLILKNDKQVVFSTTPKITQGYKIDEIKYVLPLKQEDE
jgi:hypothetical protein